MVGFDWEATGLQPYDKRDYGLGFSISVAINNDPNNIISEYFGVKHVTETGEFDEVNNLPEQAWQYLLKLVCERAAVCHNVIYDMAVSRVHGFEMTKVICTMKFNHLLNENHASYSLEAVSERVLGYNAKQKSPVFEMAMLAYGWNMPFKYMHDYAVADAGGTLKTILLDMRNARNKGEEKLFSYWTDIEAPATVALSHMRKWGVEIDTDLCREQELYGIAEKERITEYFGFNPGSPKGLAKLLLEELGLPVVARTNKGAPQFDKKAMERYELILNRSSLENNDIVQNLLTYRGWTKSVSSYYSAYQKLISPDGRLRPEYRTTGTVTGRWSCADPNLQQIPKETDKVWNGSIKECLVSANGYTGWEIDYSQLEFRLAARASNSLDLVEIFNDHGRDIFNEMAASLSWDRNPTKTLTYSTLYGAGVQRIMDAFGVDADTARQMLDHFYAQYPQLKAASKHMEYLAKKNGYVEIWSGRRRHFRNPQKEAFKAFNSFIQGGAADIVKGVMVSLFREIINEECRLLLQVHDSLWFEIKEGKEEYYLPKIMEVMSRPSKKFGVWLGVDAHPWSKREADKFGKEITFTQNPMLTV